MKNLTAPSIQNHARLRMAAGFGAVAITTLVSHASALTRTAEPPAAAPRIVSATQLAVSTDQIDWSRVPMANITPAESVAAYDR